MEMKYDLLRPFNKDHVKPGDELCDFAGVSLWAYQAGPDTNNNLSVTQIGNGEFCNPRYYPASVFRITPLGWLEGRPVYRGDKVFRVINGNAYEVLDIEAEIISFKNSEIRLRISNFTWEKPKKKINGWLNVYHGENDRLLVVWHKTREGADKDASTQRDACVPFDVEV